jgi:hypothetical protein
MEGVMMITGIFQTVVLFDCLGIHQLYIEALCLKSVNQPTSR